MRLEGRVLILVAHPDDETLAFGAGMRQWPDCTIAHTTTGAPSDPAYARAAGFDTVEAYAEARRHELDCALALVAAYPPLNFGLIDQQSWCDLTMLTRRVHKLIGEVQPAFILTHPYEGGHPDHDAASFAVQTSCTLLGSNAPTRMEGAFYNRLEGSFQANRFIPGPPETEITLDDASRLVKEQMFACFTSQASVLQLFSTSVERYRVAPQYDFTAPPHSGPLNYETLGWGMTSAMWIEAARRAQLQLDV